MLYIYDILLNWNREQVYDFFEWETTDKFVHIKKIPMFRVEKGIINQFFYNIVKLNKEFIEKIYNLTEAYTAKKIVKIPYACLITDGSTVLAIKADRQGVVKEKSKLLIDEEQEILCFSSKLIKSDIIFEKLEKIDYEVFSTRKEQKIYNFLLREINISYQKKDYDKIKYLYTEYSGQVVDGIEMIYQKLIDSLNEGIDQNHHKLYDILQLITNKN